MKCLSPVFLTEHAATLQWSFALVTLDLILSSFFANQGYCHLENKAAAVCNILSAYLYVCVFLYLRRPSGPNLPRLMILLLLVPKTEIIPNFLIQQVLVAITVLMPFLSRFQIYSLALIAFTAMPAFGYLIGGSNPFIDLEAAVCKPSATPRNGKYVSTSDQFYHLYRFDHFGAPPIYRIFRILPVCKGLSLVKLVDEKDSKEAMQIVRSQEGEYSIKEVQTLPTNQIEPPHIELQS